MRFPARAIAQSVNHGLRDFQYDEARRRIPVVFAALVDNASIPVFGGLLIRHHSIQFTQLERGGISTVVDTYSESRRWLRFGWHVSIKQREFQFQLQWISAV